MCKEKNWGINTFKLVMPEILTDRDCLLKVVTERN